MKCRGTKSSEQVGVRSTHAVQLCRNGANLPCSMLLQQAAHQTHEDAVDLGQPVSLQLERMPTSCSRTSTVKWLPAPVGGSGLSPALRHFQRSEKTVQGQHGSTVCFYCTSPPPIRTVSVRFGRFQTVSEVSGALGGTPRRVLSVNC